MNATALILQAQYLHDSTIFRWLVSVKLGLALTAIPLLWKIRAYKSKVLAHRSVSILMKCHYYYLLCLSISCSIDFSLTLYGYLSSNVHDYIISYVAHFMRRYPQVIAIHGSVSSIFMMSLERFIASKKFKTYESSKKNTAYFWGHIFYVMCVSTFGLLAYEIGASYPVSTGAPPGGQIYHKIIAGPLTIIEFLTVFLFEYLYRFNTSRMQQTGFSLTERYQISENIRILEHLRPVARFHGVITCYGTTAYLLYGREMEGDSAYPIFEECINLLQLQAILMPVVFIRHERMERSKQKAQIERNTTTSGDFVKRHNAVITNGW